MTNTDQSDYLHILSNVTKCLSLILEESDGLRVYAKFEADLDWQSLHNFELSSGKRTLLLSDSVSKTLSNERKLIFENFKSIIIQKYENSSEKLIYDKIHESLLIVEDTEAKSSSQHNDDERGDVTNTMTKSQTGLWRAQDESQIYSNSEMNERNESGSLYISLNDKLRLTRAIWYLPNLNRKFIKKLLKNKEIGNFILNEKYELSSKLNRILNVNYNLSLHVLVQSKPKLKVNEYQIKLNRSDQTYYIQTSGNSGEGQISLQFKSIYNLLEHYIFIGSSSISNIQLKLSLPKQIIDAHSLQQLVALSSLKQDFWKEDTTYLKTTTTTDSSFSTTSSLSKDYSSEFKKQAFKSLNFAQNRSIFVSDALLTNSQSSFSITDRNAKKYRSVIIDNPSTTVKDTVATKPIQIQANHKHLKAVQHREREPVGSDSVPNTSKLELSSSPPVSANTDNLNRILFRKRFRSKSLDQLPNTTKSHTTKKEKKQAVKSSTAKERYFYDPRFNKTQTSKKQPKDYKSSSFATSSSFSSDSSTYSHASNDPNIYDNNFFSRFQWLHKFLSNKLKVKQLSKNHSTFTDKSKVSTATSVTLKTTANPKKFGHFFTRLFQSSQKPADSEDSGLSENDKTSSSNTNYSASKEETPDDPAFDSVSLNSCATFTFNLVAEATLQPPPLPLTAPPSIKQDTTSITSKSDNMLGLFKRNQSKSDMTSPSPDNKTSETGTPVQIRKFLDNIGSPKKNLFRKKRDEFRRDFENHLKNSSYVDEKDRDYLTLQFAQKVHKLKNELKNKQNDISNNNTNRISNEYSEPFDHLMLDNNKQRTRNQPQDTSSPAIKKKEISHNLSSESSIGSPSLHRPITSNTVILNNKLDMTKKSSGVSKPSQSESGYQDNDSAYSSCYISQSLSSASPKILADNKQQRQGMVTIIPNSTSNFDTAEDTLVTFDSYMMHSSSSASSSPVYIDPQNHHGNNNNNNNNSYQQQRSHLLQPSPLLLKPCKQTNNKAMQTNNHRCQLNGGTKPAKMLPILSEYESVSDAILSMKSQARDMIVGGGTKQRLERNESKDSTANQEGDLVEDQADPFELTLNEYSNLTNRCNEIIGMFHTQAANNTPITARRTTSPKLRHYNSMPRKSTAEKARQLEKFIALSNENSTLKKKLSHFDYPTNNYDMYRSLRHTNRPQPKQQQQHQPIPGSSPLRFTKLYTPFLERTVTFKNLICFSSLLTSSNEQTRNFCAIRNFIFQLSQNTQTLFGKSISEFVICVNTSKEENPNTLMRDTRQFMNGIKNYLIKNNVSDFNQIIEQERLNLETTDCLNIDSILEDCLQFILLRPLKSKIYALLVDWLIKDESLVKVSQNIKYINQLDEARCMKYLALQSAEHRLDLSTLRTVGEFYKRMHCEYAPLVKLKYILYIVNELLMSHKDFSGAINDLSNLSVVSFLPVVIYAICKTNMSTIQIEIDYVWSLAYRNLLTNECIYYLTLMSSACFVLKSLDINQNQKKMNFKLNTMLSQNTNMINEQLLREYASNQSMLPFFNYMDVGLIDIHLPDDNYEKIKLKPIPVKLNSKCKEVNSLIAAKFKIFDSQDYSLYYMEDGVEVMLKEEDQPLAIKIDKLKQGVRIMFIYKKKNDNLLLFKSIDMK